MNQYINNSEKKYFMSFSKFSQFPFFKWFLFVLIFKMSWHLELFIRFPQNLVLLYFQSFLPNFISKFSIFYDSPPLLSALSLNLLEFSWLLQRKMKLTEPPSFLLFKPFASHWLVKFSHLIYAEMLFRILLVSHSIFYLYDLVVFHFNN